MSEVSHATIDFAPHQMPYFRSPHLADTDYAVVLHSRSYVKLIATFSLALPFATTVDASPAPPNILWVMSEGDSAAPPIRPTR